MIGGLEEFEISNQDDGLTINDSDSHKDDDTASHNFISSIKLEEEGDDASDKDLYSLDIGINYVKEIHGE